MSDDSYSSAVRDLVRVTDRLIYNPSLKVRMSNLGSKELDDPQLSLHIEYDPEMRRDNLLALPSEGRRNFLRSIPALAPKADEPKPFISDRSETIADLFWIPEHDTSGPVGRFVQDHYALKLIEALLVRRALPLISEHVRPFLRDSIIASIPLLTLAIRESDASVVTVDNPLIGVRDDVAREFFGFAKPTLCSGTKGFSCIAPAESVQ